MYYRMSGADSGLAGMDNISYKVNTIQKSDDKQDSDRQCLAGGRKLLLVGKTFHSSTLLLIKIIPIFMSFIQQEALLL